MSTKKLYSLFCNRCVSTLLCFFIFLMVGTSSAQQDNKSNTCMSLKQVTNLLEKEVSEKEIIKQIKLYKVDFAADRKSISLLVRAGASDELLEAIEQNQCKDITIISPSNGFECGKTLRVDGLCKKIPGKHLWLFAHLKGLSVWWPQRGEINVEEDGTWMQGAYLGGEQDVGFDFEIIVQWIDEQTHTRMVNYLANGEATGDFPGIKLPEGSPSARVVVKKVRH